MQRVKMETETTMGNETRVCEGGDDDDDEGGGGNQ